MFYNPCSGPLKNYHTNIFTKPVNIPIKHTHRYKHILRQTYQHTNMQIYQTHTHRYKTHTGHNFVTYQIDKYQTNVLTKIYNTMNEYLILEFEKKSPGKCQSVSR